MGKKRKASRSQDADTNYTAQLTSFQKKNQRFEQNEEINVGKSKGIKPQLVRILPNEKSILE